MVTSYSPKIIKEEVEQIDGKTFVITTFDNGEVIFVEFDES